MPLQRGSQGFSMPLKIHGVMKHPPGQPFVTRVSAALHILSSDWSLVPLSRPSAIAARNVASRSCCDWSRLTRSRIYSLSLVNSPRSICDLIHASWLALSVMVLRTVAMVKLLADGSSYYWCRLGL